MTDQCGVRWGTHSCRYTNDGHLVGVDCECHCDDAGDLESGYPYDFPENRIDFRPDTPGPLGETAQRNFEHAIRWGPA